MKQYFEAVLEEKGGKALLQNIMIALRSYEERSWQADFCSKKWGNGEAMRNDIKYLCEALDRTIEGTDSPVSRLQTGLLAELLSALEPINDWKR